MDSRGDSLNQVCLDCESYKAMGIRMASWLDEKDRKIKCFEEAWSQLNQQVFLWRNATCDMTKHEAYTHVQEVMIILKKTVDREIP